MKKIFSFISLSVLLLCSCSKEEKPFEITNTEAFAYSLQPGWELNASANVMGFKQNVSEDDEYSARLSYSLHLITPESDTLFETDNGFIDKHESEELIDIQIESQMEIDSSYSVGNYKVIFEITDDLVKKTITAVKEFELTTE